MWKSYTGNNLWIYAPTSNVSRKNPEKREKFYETLDQIINKFNNRSFIILCGDFNAKTGSSWQDYPEVLGQYGKGITNENGLFLLDFAREHNLTLTNTLFDHKMCHRTTWTAPFRKCIDKQSNKIRQNPYRNQIDYICVKDIKNITVTNARSYGGTRTSSDHKLVIADIKLKWKYNITPKKTKKHNIDYQKFTVISNQKAYQMELTSLLKKSENPQNIQERWKRLVKVTQEAAVKTVGMKNKNRKTENEKIKKLSDEQKQLKIQLNNTDNRKK